MIYTQLIFGWNDIFTFTRAYINILSIVDDMIPYITTYRCRKAGKILYRIVWIKRNYWYDKQISTDKGT